ncbi:MAG: tetratricopeptide repeat protein [Lentimicrobiaceae bacterium]|jgi:tetratricopeptide (TPR) repeat protein|nr:tetratricopeptide repeat protein [Lentimicrobiaceae bacterium]
MKKKIILLVLFLSVISNLVGQEECSDYELQNFSVLSEVQSYIDDAKGWSIQDNGKWAYGTNLIPYTDSRTNLTRLPQVAALGQDNFIILELRKVMIEEKQYNVLIKKYRDGEYEFPFLASGWESYNSLEFWVFKSEKLIEILPDEVPFNVMYLVDLEIFCYGEIKNYDRIPYTSSRFKNNATGVIESVPAIKSRGYVDDLIVRKIEQVKTGKIINDGNMIFAVFPIKVDDQEAVHFKFVKTYRNETLLKMQTSPDNWTHLFDYEFYEVTYSVFEDFIKGSRQYYVDTEAETEYLSYYNWGMLRYQIGDYLGAIEAFTNAIKADPNAADYLIYSHRGLSNNKAGKYADAARDFTKAIELQPNNITQYSDWVKSYYNRGVANYNRNEMQQACRDWHQAYDLGFGTAGDQLKKYCDKYE